MKILHLWEQIEWFGGHTGYGLLSRHMPATEQVWTVKIRRGKAARYAGSAYARPGRGELERAGVSIATQVAAA